MNFPVDLNPFNHLLKETFHQRDSWQGKLCFNGPVMGRQAAAEHEGIAP